MNVQQSLTKKYSHDFIHIQNEFRRHSTASAISVFFLALFAFPVILVGGFEIIFSRSVAAYVLVFLFFSFLPDFFRLICRFKECHTINALSHSFPGALFFSSFSVLVPAALFGLWMPSLFIFSFLGYVTHLFIDSIESAMECWVNLLQAILSSPIFVSLEPKKIVGDLPA